MKALWIRVEAHEVDSPRIEMLADALGVDLVTALGHYVALGGAIAEHSPDGNLLEIADGQLERWAHWTGRRGRFAAAIRSQLQTEDGEFADWEESMGKLIERRAADRERQEERRKTLRADRARRKAEKAGKSSADKPGKSVDKSADTPPSVRGQSADNPPPVRGLSADKGRNSSATERNGRNGTYGTTTALQAESRGKEPVDRSASLRSGTRTTDQLPPIARRFLDRFYPVTGRRRTDVIGQLATLAAGEILDIGKEQYVQAYTVERLEAKCADVIAESSSIRDLNAAMAILFTKLGDTSDDSAPGVHEAQRLVAPDPDSAAIDEWIEQHPFDVLELREEIELALDPTTPADMRPLLIDAQLRTAIRARFALPTLT